MGEDKEKSQALKNPSVREKVKANVVVDPAIELAKRIWHLESYIKELNQEQEHIERRLQKNFSQISFFFLIIGCIVGFIAGAILL